MLEKFEMTEKYYHFFGWDDKEFYFMNTII